MCWRLFRSEMYEGKNIHYSLQDNKPLCSFSQKQCNQRRLNGYGFCVRHILEDPTAPFRRCAYVAKSSQHLCTQAIPQGEDRAYCNNHMQVLGMLPRRERKPKKEKDKDKDKEKVSINKDKDNLTPVDASKMTFGDRLKVKSKKLPFPKTGPSPIMTKVLNPVDDPDDPYAFHDAAPEVSPVTNTITPMGSTGMLPGGLADMASRSPYPQSLPSPSQSRSVGEGAGVGGMPKAKLYPELAEKLEKPRPSQDTKTAKSRARSSRTMNKLQTKIAQNKIKDKLRKSQESNQTELSPSQVASPERLGLSASALLNSGIADFGPVSGSDMNSVGLSSQQVHPLTIPGVGLPHIDSNRVRDTGVGSLPGTAAQLLEVERLNAGRIPAQHLPPFHPLPPPYPGLPAHREQPFSPVPGTDSVRAPGSSPVMEPPVTTSLPSHTHLNPFLSFSQASSLSSPVVSPAQSQPLHLQQLKSSPQPRTLPPHQSQTTPPKAHSVVSLDSADLPRPHLSSVLKQSVTNRLTHSDSASGAFPQTSAILTSKQSPSSALLSPRTADVRSSHDLPPPPPYVPRTVAHSLPTSVTASSSVLRTHVQRPKGVLTKTEACSRLKNGDAVKLYGMYVQQKIKNHVFMNSTMSLCTSDEESDSEELVDELLPFQRDWKVISDDEEDNELEEDGELPSDLRMVKLGVMRARYRRHCTQTKHATRINTKSMTTTRKFTLALIRLAKSSPSCASQTLSAMYGRNLQWPQDRKHKRKQIWKKVCQYKDGADKQCTVMCLPYTNHCRKHVMYNVDQQLFQFCTAKNSDNTQCCMPVIDIRHDFPQCYPHALQAELQRKEEAAELKKRPRKKTKPPALTRPPRKKKKAKNIRYQKPIPPDAPSKSDESEPTPMEVTPAATESPPDSAPTAPAPSQPPVSVAPTPAPPPPGAAAAAAAAVVSTPQVVPKEAPPPAISGPSARLVGDMKQQLEQALDLEETDFDKQFAELPLEQASRLLEDDAFENFPDDAFNDIFSMADKNGEADALARENEKLEQQLAEVTDKMIKTKDALDKLLNGSISIEDMGEQDKDRLAEMIAINYPVDHVQQADLTTSASAALDPYNRLSAEQTIGDIALSLQSQQPQPPLTDFTHSASVATGSRGLLPQTTTTVTAAFLPPGVGTTVNGISVPGALPQNSVAYNQALVASLTAGYAGSSAVPPQSGSVHSGHIFSEGHLQPNYQVVQTASQGHSQLAGFSGLQTLPSAGLLLSGGVAENLTAQQQALLARTLSQQQQQQQQNQAQTRVTATTASLPPIQGISRQLDVASGSLHSQQSHSAETLLPQTGLTSASTGAHQLARGMTVPPQPGPSGVSGHAAQSSTTATLSNPLQAQPVLAAQLASGSHSTWVHAAVLQQQSGHAAGYHSVNGFPTTAQLPYQASTAAVSAAHMLPSSSTVVRQPKVKSHPPQMKDVSQVPHAAGNPTSTAFTTITKADHSQIANLVNAIRANTASSPPVPGLKQDPRIAALTQQHSRTVGRSGSPGVPGFRPGHSPSPTLPHSPQALTQGLPPFSAALPAYQGNGNGS